MKAKTEFRTPDREAAARRFRLALFIVAELLCTGVILAAAIHWM